MEKSDEYLEGYRQAIKDLRKIGDSFRGVRAWSISRELKFAPVELSDRLVTQYYNKYLEGRKSK